MVLQDSDEGIAPPFDSSLYGASYSPSTPATEYEIEYEGCEAVGCFFTVSDDVRAILPEGVELATSPAQGGVVVAHYPFSTVGEYHEVFYLVLVEDVEGKMAYYIPYIYVTNDAALAAGRELAGAPKKLAEIDVESDGDTVVGTMERPSGKRLLTVTVKPDSRSPGGFGGAGGAMPDPTPLLSVRHLPPVEGGDGLTQLVEWYADADTHEDGDGEEKAWTGPTDVTHDSTSVVDPVHRMEPEEVMMGMYYKFDMALGFTTVQKEWEL